MFDMATSNPSATALGGRQHLTVADAKAQVFAHWQLLEALTRRRFPQNENLASEAGLYVLSHLQDQDWRRVRCWEGMGHFASFLSTLASRLLTDFSREKFGYIRKPAWLAKQTDPIWDLAYRLLKVDGYRRHEAMEILCLHHPERDRWFIADVVTAVLQRCHSQPRYQEQQVSMEACAEPVATGEGPAQAMEYQDKELLEALQTCLEADGPTPSTISRRVTELLERLEPHLNLGEEDRLLLRLRYLDGLRIQAIAKMLHLSGDPYKRFNKLIGQLRETCRRAGVLPV